MIGRDGVMYPLAMRRAVSLATPIEHVIGYVVSNLLHATCGYNAFDEREAELHSCDRGVMERADDGRSRGSGINHPVGFVGRNRILVLGPATSSYDRVLHS